MACDSVTIINEFEQIRNHLHVFLAIRSAVPVASGSVSGLVSGLVSGSKYIQEVTGSVWQIGYLINRRRVSS